MNKIMTIIGMSIVAMGSFAQSDKTIQHDPQKIKANNGKQSTEYDLSHQKRIGGEIVKVFWDRHFEDAEFHMIVLVENKEVPVFLAPQTYMQFLDFELKKGAVVSMTGAFVAQKDGTDVFLVRVLYLFDKDIQIIFRDECGRPLWDEAPGMHDGT